MGLTTHLVDERDGPRITHNDLSPVVQIIGWLCLTFAILFVAAQFLTKWTLAKRPGTADGVLLLALALASGQSATLLRPSGRVIGQSPTRFSYSEWSAGLEALYVGDLLNILALATIKGSLLISFHDITPSTRHRTAIYLSGAVVTAWAITAVFATALQCPSPERWNVLDQACKDLIATRTYTASMNILTDAALMVIPTIIVFPLKMRLTRRLAALAAFWARMIVIGATISYIISMRRLSLDGDYLLNVWKTVICNQVVLATSIVTACVPFLKPFMLSLESGFLRVDDENRRTANNASGSGFQSGRSVRNTSTWQESRPRTH